MVSEPLPVVRPLRRGVWPVETRQPQSQAPASLRPLPFPASSNEIDEAVVASLIQDSDLVDRIAVLTSEALVQVCRDGAEIRPDLIKGVAARVATGLAIGLMESTLVERIEQHLAEAQPFAEGHLSCPE